MDVLLKKILNKISTGVVDTNGKIFNETFKLDFSVDISYEYINDGKILLVHDVPIAKEMVQKYGDGFHYKSAEAIDKINTEYSPIALYHPENLFNEMNDSDKLQNLIGYTLGGYTKDNKKYTDMYFIVEVTPKRVIEDIEKGQSTDVSIGFNVQFEDTPGEFEGQHYDRVQKVIKLDHTAVLPDAVGRASFPDGVGIGADNSNIKNGGDIMPDDKLVQALEDKGELASKLKDSESEVKELTVKFDQAQKEIKTLKDEASKVDEFKKKAEKFDEHEEASKADEDKKVDSLKKEILKVRSDEKFKKFIEKMDSEKLQFTLDELKATPKGLPVKKDDKNKDTDPSLEGMHPADVVFKKNYEEKTGQKLV